MRFPVCLVPRTSEHLTAGGDCNVWMPLLGELQGGMEMQETKGVVFGLEGRVKASPFLAGTKVKMGFSCCDGN